MNYFSDRENLKKELKRIAGSLHCDQCVLNNQLRSCCECIADDALEYIESLENKTPDKKEAVNHPDHYKSDKYECIEVMTEIFGVEKTKAFCELNAFKYLWRADKKGSRKQDVEKAAWYLSKYKELSSDE